MEKYEVIGSLGEGSFGRVYKVKQLSNGEIVALKVISKRGKSNNEIKDLKSECVIQKKLTHPNIIQMLDSFETENEIVVITEFAHKALNVILNKEGYLSEIKVQSIVWDLVSALYYLHSHRVLHRDLKPQNILLDVKNKAKLCDFGFARNMSTGTHVLTSIKGTPLYMAPELIDELPYDHNADLWSLGCIIYELLVGAPPFCTASILHLIRMIRTEQVQWPTFLSDQCITFLKGLLQKDPKKRMSWIEILNHPFVEGHILILEDDCTKPLTRPLSSNALQEKSTQRKDYINQKNNSANRLNSDQNKPNSSKRSQELKNNNTLPELAEKQFKNSSDLKSKTPVDSPENEEFLQNFNKSTNLKRASLDNILSDIEHQPLELEEWMVFLLKTMEEIINGELISLTQSNLTIIIISPLRNINTHPKIIINIAKLFSLPFALQTCSKHDLEKVQKVYLDIKLIPNIINASKLLLTVKNENSTELINQFKNFNDLNEEELDAIQYIYLLVCNLIHQNKDFLVQLCDAFAVLHISTLLHNLFSFARKRVRILLDLIAILTYMLKHIPENYELIESILKNTSEDEYEINFANLLRHDDSVLRERICYLLIYLNKSHSELLVNIWDENVKETVDALIYDSVANVRQAAERCCQEIGEVS